MIHEINMIAMITLVLGVSMGMYMNPPSHTYNNHDLAQERKKREARTRWREAPEQTAKQPHELVDDLRTIPMDRLGKLVELFPKKYVLKEAKQIYSDMLSGKEFLDYPEDVAFRLDLREVQTVKLHNLRLVYEGTPLEERVQRGITYHARVTKAVAKAREETTF